MGSVFNISADCKPELHYMVNIENRLREIKRMIDWGDYFTINRARQYGKTTTLRALGNFLKDDYTVISMDFQMLGASKFKSENAFSVAFGNVFTRALENQRESEAAVQAIQVFKEAIRKQKSEIELLELFGYLSDLCMCLEKPVVLLIDEVDSAADNQVFGSYCGDIKQDFWDAFV